MPNNQSISKTIDLAINLGDHFVAKSLHLPPPMPINYTLSLTYKCQSRCKTCRIYEHEPVKELLYNEWAMIFKNMRGAYWITFSGGEPFLRDDIVQLFNTLCDTCHPAIVNIPTNGIAKSITDKVLMMAQAHPDVKLGINVSIDHSNAFTNDEIRGVKTAYKAFDTFRELKDNKLPNMTIGIHSVISRFNVADYKEIIDGLLELKPDQYITEIAENRFELGNVGLTIAPTSSEYDDAIEYLQGKIKNHEWIGQAKITEAFRSIYYNRVQRFNDGYVDRWNCYAGRANIQIAPDGEVWACCINAQSMGNLRDYGYDIKKVMRSKKAKGVMRGVDGCVCPMANISYLNMLYSPKALWEVAKRITR